MKRLRVVLRGQVYGLGVVVAGQGVALREEIERETDRRDRAP
ncbi:hypothetical protein [Streptomyces sp. HUCO-GS316]|nr:hypothetical protein [Streptomyces sp. HUCO-GS316]